MTNGRYLFLPVINHSVTLILSLSIQRPGVGTRELVGAPAPRSQLQAFFFVVSLVLWRLCVGRLRPGRVPTVPVFLPRAQLPPNPVGRIVAAPLK